MANCPALLSISEAQSGEQSIHRDAPGLSPGLTVVGQYHHPVIANSNQALAGMGDSEQRSVLCMG
ncbi:hypothetical protein D3C75_945810 [compost metagenome]